MSDYELDDFRTEVDEHGNIKVTSYVEAVVISKEEQEQTLRTFKKLQEENDKLRELMRNRESMSKMSDANMALAEVRSWLCDNLGSGDAGKVCGMLSVVSRRINELEVENAKLRNLVVRMFHTIEWSDRMSDSMYWPSFSYEQELRELGVEVDDG